jgi:AraC-like DNA-binding protein
MEIHRAAPRPVALMRVAGLTPIVACLGRAGAPVMRLLQRVHLPPWLFDRPEALIPTCQVARFIEESARVRGFESVGRVAGRETPVEALGVFGRLVRRARTVREAIDTAIRNTPAFDSGSRLRLERDGRRARLCHEFVDATDVAHRPLGEYWSMLATNVIRLAAEPSDHIESRETAVTFPDSVLGRPLSPPSPRRPDDDDIDAWRASAPAGDFTGSVLQVTTTLGSSGHPRIAGVAGASGMSVRALQRRLAEAGVTFETLVARERFGTAVELLEKTDATILDIALDLGYSDHAHFTRAFRRWTGIPPREFRRTSRERRGPSEVSGGLTAERPPLPPVYSVGA